jgi:hypothetical protein
MASVPWQNRPTNEGRAAQGAAVRVNPRPSGLTSQGQGTLLVRGTRKRDEGEGRTPLHAARLRNS